MSQQRLNEKFVNLMEQLANIMLKKGENFRARAYQKAQETIISYPSDILSPNDLKDKPGIGETIMEKLNEFVNTGTLTVIEREKNNPINILSEVYGIGPKKASELVKLGIQTISSLRENQHLLNDIQKVGLQYYEDILKRIPRSEIQIYEKIFQNALPKNNHVKMEIVGSYRRGADNSGDIDVIITSNNKNDFVLFVNKLLEQNIILHVLSRGPSKCLVITKLNSESIARRVDFLYTSPNEFPFAILYFTGSKIFNTVMRQHALENGYTMNEHEICVIKKDKSKIKVNDEFKSEKDIFEFLGLEFKSPQERHDGRSVVKKQHVVQSQKITIVGVEPNNEIYLNFANKFRQMGVVLLEKLNENQLADIIRQSNHAYYNKQQFLTDNEYDIIKEFIENKYPSNPVIYEIGASVETNKVKLPYFMGSMNKMKSDANNLPKWTNKYKGPYIVSAKLDGVSALYCSTSHLFTRGDGQFGENINHLIPYLRLPKTKDIVLRGEFVLPKALYEAKYANKYVDARNAVIGIINSKEIHQGIKDIHFVAYEVIQPILKPSDQMEFLKTLDVECVLYDKLIPHNFDNTMLSNMFMDWRENYAYKIDGLIATDDNIYERQCKNPSHSFAFKMVLTEQMAEVKVLDVIWGISQDGYLKPRVNFEPVIIGGSEYNYSTGHNAAFIYNNKIGVGAIIEIIRSNDVIPKITRVITPAEVPKMPIIPYEWNESMIEIIVKDVNTNETVKEKNIVGFFQDIGVECLGSGNVKRIMNAGFDTIPKILRMNVDDFLSVEGFKEKMANKIYNGIHERLDEVSFISLMTASNMFGRGFSDKRLQLIMDEYPTILLTTESNEKKIEKISSIKGIARKTAELFVEKIPNFIDFIRKTGLVKKLAKFIEEIKEEKNINVDTSHPLYNKSIVVTGFRFEDDVEDKIKSLGCKISSSVSNKTFIVVSKDINKESTKLNEAKKMNIQIMSDETFKSTYGL